MVIRRLLAIALLATAAAACSDSATSVKEPPTSAAPPATAPTGTAAPATTAPPATSTTTTTVATGVPGAAGLGDPYLPRLGNGGYDVEHYTIELDVDPIANAITGVATIDAVATENLSSFNLDFAGLTIATISVDDAEAGFSRSENELTVSPTAILAAGENFVTSIEYAGTPTPQSLPGLPLALGWQGGSGATFVVSEPNGAQNWFPANDHPSDKATYTFRITAPSDFTVAANGTLAGRIDDGAETTFVWEMDQPMASYLATVLVARQTEDVTTGPGGLPIRNYFPDTVPNGPELFARTAEMIEFVEEIVGPYPFDAYGVAVAGGFPAALETQSLSVFGVPVLTASQRTIDRVAMHELAHQWFGDSVSPATWQDVWLNEGFASYFEQLWIEHTEGEEAYDASVQGFHSQAADAPLPAPADPGVGNLFGGAVYLRGALTLHALRTEVGDETFFMILRTYYERFAYGNASTADFVEVASEVAERDLGGFLSPWLDDPVVPALP